MRNECSIVRDILPLYAENMVSDDTAAFVREHLEGCPACREELERIKAPVYPEPDLDAAPLKKLKQALLLKRVQTILCTVAVLLALMLSVLAFLTAPEFFSYSPELITAAEGENGAAVISFGREVTNYTLQRITDPEEQRTIYHIEAWTTVWDRMFQKPGAQDVIVEPEDGRVLIIFFTDNINLSTTSDAVCIFGTLEPDRGGWMALPGLSLGYLLLINALLFAAFGVAWLLLRKKGRPRKWIERLLLLPVAYGLGHFCVLRFRTVSYSEWRDFQLIFAIGVLFYCAILLALNIYRAMKEKQQMKSDGK